MNEGIKDELRCWKTYEEERKKIKAILKKMEDDETSVKGVRYDKIPGTPNPLAMDMAKAHYSDVTMELEKDLKRVEMQLKHLSDILDEIADEEIRIAIKKVYCLKIPMRIVAKEMNFSKSGLGKKMDKALSELKRGRILAKCVL